MNILVPLAGKDESFINSFGDLKPFIEINGIPLIQFVLCCLPFNLDKLIIVCLREYETKFRTDSRLRKIFGHNTRIVWADKLTEGSLCSALLAQEYIDNDEDLLIDLADIYFDPLNLKNDIARNKQLVAGIIPINRDTIIDRPWGYVYFDNQGMVKELREKEINPQGNNATLGLYYFSQGRDFVKYAKLMMTRNERVTYNNLFYIAPVYNLIINDGKSISACETKILHLFGKPADVLAFINKDKIQISGKKK